MGVPLANFSATEPACFTRFVLPFAYQLERCAPHGTGESRFEPLTTDAGSGTGQEGVEGLFSRRMYLTPESSFTLFERARWLRMVGGSAARHYEVTRNEGRSVRVRLEAPMAVLFEARRGTPRRWRKPRAGEPDLLRTGFLIQDATLEPAARGELRLEDLLEFNECYRYLRRPYPKHQPRFSQWLEPGADPEAEYFGRWDRALQTVACDEAGRPCRLNTSSAFERARRWLDGQSAWGDDAGWLVHADDRTFVWTCACVPGGAHGLGDAEAQRRRWYWLLDVDAEGAHPELSPFEKRWVHKHTYRRWEQDGTKYGFCHHAAAMITGPASDPDLALFRHWRTMHFDLVLILLYLRVGCFRFSLRLSRVSADLLDRGLNQSDRLTDLRASFAWFTNLYRFPTLSNQQQALEMYEMARTRLDVDELFAEVQTEITTTDEFVRGRDQHQNNADASTLNRIATIGLALALGLAVYEVGSALVDPSSEPSAITGKALWLLRDEWPFILLVAVVLAVPLWVVSYLPRLRPKITGAWHTVLGRTRRVARWVAARYK